jgi:hypothetical protein
VIEWQLEKIGVFFLGQQQPSMVGQERASNQKKHLAEVPDILLEPFQKASASPPPAAGVRQQNFRQAMRVDTQNPSKHKVHTTKYHANTLSIKSISNNTHNNSRPETVFIYFCSICHPLFS